MQSTDGKEKMMKQKNMEKATEKHLEALYHHKMYNLHHAGMDHEE